ncbi:YveK family protein [Lacticaseibacillus jixianensis]|uniref:Capsular polysaccharide biosynthesis protein CpsC n=1 Tax=Lacticaseibacillus jixianensis TaxID=2486012 RepID=A0ABW4BDJ1_9LACO|nr:Wzz/FepE/Etk N-terminal domain-containing protein [Lacticaseibacillus jixianensis]
MDDEVISLGQIFSILRKHVIALIVAMCAGGVFAAAITYLVMQPKYESTAMVLVNRKQTAVGQQYNDLQTDLQMINTYKDIITKDVVLRPVRENLLKKGVVVGSTGDLARAISVTNNQNSQVMSVTAKADDPYTARSIVNETAEVFRTKITTIMTNAKNVTIISRGTLNKSAVSPRKKINIAVGLLAGLVLGILFAFLRALTDRTVKDSSFITDTLELPLLGTITDIDSSSIKLGTKGLRPTAGHSRR